MYQMKNAALPYEFSQIPYLVGKTLDYPNRLLILPKNKEDLFYAQDQLDPENQPLWQPLLITF